MHIFVLFLKRQNIEKFIIFWKEQDFEKEMQSNFSNVGFNRNLSKKTQFNKKCISFSTFKTNRSVPNIY